MPEHILREEIAVAGVISFARFMEMALYLPETGYYEADKSNVGHRGDFVTSVTVGEIFGQLLGFQFAEWLNLMRSAECGVRIVESGAHDGKLAGDILKWLQQFRPELFSEIEYCIIEPSARRQSWQHESLKVFSNVRWFTSFEDLKQKTKNAKPRGILFGNELLDAFPVQRLGWDASARKWFEWGVSWEGVRFVWVKMQQPMPRLPSTIRNLPSSLLDVLPDGYTLELCPAAENWWREAAGVLQHGKLMAIDYGHTAEEFISPSRPNGTLRAYYRHRVTDDILANPGQQDITAHVHFTAIQNAGEAAGLKTELFVGQSQFLTRIASKMFQNPEPIGKWSPKQVRQFQTLTHPEHLGRQFRVLVQGKFETRDIG